jgi:hypothetical protein
MDVATLSAAYEERVRALFGGELPKELRLAGRLAPEQWTLEWHLPWWVGRALGLDEGTAEELALANVLGVVAIRLRDDADDDELAGTDPGRAADLSARLLDAALEPYRRRLAADSPFWPSLERWLDDATPGAPLKAAMYGVCLLADRPAAWPELEQCLDHALAALVLYDHAVDWEADLPAGRPNHFAAHLGAGTADDVAVALMAGDRSAGYFERIESELAQASALADALGVGDLAGHLRALSARLRSDGLALQAHYSAVGDRAAVLFS